MASTVGVRTGEHVAVPIEDAPAVGIETHSTRAIARVVREVGTKYLPKRQAAENDEHREEGHRAGGPHTLIEPLRGEHVRIVRERIRKARSPIRKEAASLDSPPLPMLR